MSEPECGHCGAMDLDPADDSHCEPCPVGTEPAHLSCVRCWRTLRAELRVRELETQLAAAQLAREGENATWRRAVDKLLADLAAEIPARAQLDYERVRALELRDSARAISDQRAVRLQRATEVAEFWSARADTTDDWQRGVSHELQVALRGCPHSASPDICEQCAEMNPRVAMLPGGRRLCECATWAQEGRAGELSPDPHVEHHLHCPKRQGYAEKPK